MKNKYKAFITYSHADSKVASWLQRTLESYHVPARLVGKKRRNKAIPARVKPIFRDRDEISAGSNLSQTIDEALKNSEYLIVVCSPAARKSKWVNLEISEYKKTHGPDKVICVIAAGEPFADSGTDQEGQECFPDALGYRNSLSGLSDNDIVEPVAADLRPDADGRKLAKLKLVAGLIGVGLDELVQRDAQRRQWRLLGLSVASTVGMAIMAVLSFVAIDARHNEELRRAEAEDLIEFMLSDLRERLEPVGRLDVLDAVGQQAIEYYSKVDLDEHTEDSLGRRARAFHLLGEVDDLRGDVDKARSAFDEANQSTEELLRRAPGDGQRIYNHAQSVFWVGYLDWRLGNYEGAGSAFNEYVSLSRQLIDIDPDNIAWLAELGHSNINLGVYTFETGLPAEAITYFDRARSVFEEAARRDPENGEWPEMVAQALAWSADANRESGSLRIAMDHRMTEAEIYREILKREPDNQTVNRYLIASHRARAAVSLDAGDVATAVSELHEAQYYGNTLLALDPNNTLTIYLTASVHTTLAESLIYESRFQEANLELTHATQLTNDLVSRDKGVLEWKLLQQNIKIQQYRYLRATGEIDRAMAGFQSVSSQLHTLANDNPESNLARYLLADARYFTCVILRQTGKTTDFDQLANTMLLELQAIQSELPPAQLALLRFAADATGYDGKAEKIELELKTMGYRHPLYLTQDG